MEKRTGSIHVSNLLLLELRQSLRFQVWLHTKDKTRGFTKHDANQMQGDIASDLKKEVFEIVEVDWAVVHQKAGELSKCYTATNGHRLVDILHVATALHLGSADFLTFDENQKRLAEAEGLNVPV